MTLERERTPRMVQDSAESGVENISYSSYLSDLGNIQRDLLLSVRKEVKDEHKNISMIHNVCLSAFTDDPMNIALVAQSSEGKTYTVIKAVEKFPKKYLWIYRKVSPKTFTRERGQLTIRIIEGNKEIFTTETEDKLNGKGKIDVRRYYYLLKTKLLERIGEREPDKDKKEKDKAKASELLSELEDNLYTLIDFRDKILVFLDRPDPSLWNELLSVLSHDKEYIVTSFVEGEGKKYTRKVVFQGWPAVIFCTSKEEDFNWKDLETRFQIIEPVMTSKKYTDAVYHNFNKEYSLDLATSEDEELAGRLEKLISWIIKNRPKVIFPFPPEEVPKAITGGKVVTGDLMRKIPRIGRHVAMNALFNLPERVVLYNGKQHAIVVAYRDIASLGYLFDDLDLGASLEGIGTASFELLTNVIAPMFIRESNNAETSAMDESSRPDSVRNSDAKKKFEEYLKTNRTSHMGSSAESFSRYRKNLEERGYVKTVEDENDKRGLRIIPTWLESPEKKTLISKLRKLVTPREMTDVTIDMYLKTLNFSPFLEGEKIGTILGNDTQNEKFVVLGNKIIWALVREYSGFDVMIVPIPLHYSDHFYASLSDTIIPFYYTSVPRNFIITQTKGEEISGTYEINVGQEDIIRLPNSVARQMENLEFGKPINEDVRK